MKISAAVGLGCANRVKDVATVQLLLNRYLDAGNLPGFLRLVVDGDWGPKSIAVFTCFELIFMGWPSGKVEPACDRMRKLDEMSYAGLEKLLKKFDEPSYSGIEKLLKKLDEEQAAWEKDYDASGVDAIAWAPDEAKDWARTAPSDDVETGFFKSNDAWYGGVVAWKSAEPQRFSINDRWRRLMLYQLKPESAQFYEQRGASSTEALILSKTMKAWNSAVYYYVCEKKMSPSDAFARIRIESTDQLLQVLDLVSMLPSGKITTIKFVKERPDNVSRIEYLNKIAEDNYDHVKTFIDRWSAIKKKYFT
jgi:hypothetical protein